MGSCLTTESVGGRAEEEGGARHRDAKPVRIARWERSSTRRGWRGPAPIEAPLPTLATITGDRNAGEAGGGHIKPMASWTEHYFVL